MADGDGVDKDAIWTAADEEDDPPATDAPASDGDGSEPSAAWEDDDAPPNRTVLIAQISLVVLVLIGVGVILAVKSHNDDKASTDKTSTSAGDGKDDGTGTGTNGKTTVKKAQWPATISNRPPALGKRGQKAPDVKSTAKPGVYVWLDFDGWHLWVVGGEGMPAKVTGTITSNDTIARGESATPDAGTVTKNGKQVTFDVPTDKPITGVDFNPGFYAKVLAFTIQGDAGPLDNKLIHLGGKAGPAPFPLSLTKA